MLAKIFEKNLEFSSCWFSAWNVHMWSPLQLSSQHMFLLAETFSSRWDISSTIISCRKSCFTVNIFFVLPGEKHLGPEGFHASPTLTRSLSPSSYFSAPCLLHLFFSSFSSFSAAASSLSPENPSIVRILGQQRFFQFRQSYSCHIYKVLNPHGVIYKNKNKRNKCDQFIEMMQNSFPGLCNPRTNWGFFEIWRKVFEGEILCPSVRNAGYLSKEFLHIFTMRLRHWSP